MYGGSRPATYLTKTIFFLSLHAPCAPDADAAAHCLCPSAGSRTNENKNVLQPFECNDGHQNWHHVPSIHSISYILSFFIYLTLADCITIYSLCKYHRTSYSILSHCMVSIVPFGITEELDVSWLGYSMLYLITLILVVSYLNI